MQINMNPLISIVIPTYNRVQDLKRAINSVFQQSYNNWELIIVDNSSGDGTDEFVNSLNDVRIKFYQIQNDGVIALSRNLGVKHARGEFVAFLDSDDWWKSKKLELSLQALMRGADLVYHDLYRVTKHNQKLFWSKARTRRLYSPVFNDLIMNGWAINNSSVVVRRKLLNEIGGLSEDRDLVAAEDFDGWLRISRLAENFIRIPDTLGYYWLGGGNTNNPKRALQTLAAIEIRYKKEIGENALLASFYWLHYVKGRANYMLGNYELANKNLKAVLSKKIPLFIYVKCQFMRVFIFLKHVRKSLVD